MATDSMATPQSARFCATAAATALSCLATKPHAWQQVRWKRKDGHRFYMQQRPPTRKQRKKYHRRQRALRAQENKHNPPGSKKAARLQWQESLEDVPGQTTSDWTPEELASYDHYDALLDDLMGNTKDVHPTPRPVSLANQQRQLFNRVADQMELHQERQQELLLLLEQGRNKEEETTKDGDDAAAAAAAGASSTSKEEEVDPQSATRQCPSPVLRCATAASCRASASSYATSPSQSTESLEVEIGFLEGSAIILSPSDTVEIPADFVITPEWDLNTPGTYNFNASLSSYTGPSVTSSAIVNVVVPEPSSLVLLALGGLGLMRRRR